MFLCCRLQEVRGEEENVDPIPVEGVVMWREALNHEVLDNNEVVQNIFPRYLQKSNKPHFISLSRHRLRALDAGTDGALQNLREEQSLGRLPAQTLSASRGIA